MLDQLDTRSLPAYSLEWWLARLGARLDYRRGHMLRAEDYYNGEQPLAFASEKFLEAFGGRFREFSSNFMALVVDTHRERLQVQGIRYGTEQQGDKDAWAWWQRNRLDAESAIAHHESLVKGVSYVTVWPNADGEPEASVEDPLQMVVETVPGKSWMRLAAMKRWMDEGGHLRAEVYLPRGNPGALPSGVYRFTSEQRDQWFSWDAWASVVQPKWTRDEPFFVPNRLGVVPVVPIPNRPRLVRWRYGRPIAHDGQSEISMVMSNQDAINKLRMDMLVSSEFAAFRQRWAIGVDIPVDPVTGLPIEPFKAAVDRLWVVPPADPNDSSPSQVQFGEFAATDLTPYLNAIRSEVGAVASITRTPYHYFLGEPQQVPPSGDSLTASEDGLIGKVRTSQGDKADGWEEVFRLQFAWRSDPRADVIDAEVIWRDPERKTESEHMDALSKLKALGVPDELIWEMVPFSPQQIARIRRLNARAALLAPVAPPASATPPTNGQAPVVVARAAQ